MWVHQIGESSRKSALWVKMKPEYSDQTEDMDLLILAAGFADGKMRSGLLSKFLVGVAVPTEEGQQRKQFYALVRVSNGMDARSAMFLPCFLFCILFFVWGVANISCCMC